MDILKKHPWPGNVRQFKNCIEHASIISDGELIRPRHLGPDSQIGNETHFGRDDSKININMSFDPEAFTLDAAIDRILDIVLEKCGNNKSRAAKVLGVSRKIFYRSKQ